MTSSKMRTMPLAVAMSRRRLEVAGLGRDDAGVAHDRLGQDRRDLMAALGHQPLDGVDVVPWQDRERLADDVGDAGAAGQGDRALMRARQGKIRVVAPFELVRPAVVLTLELDDDRPPGPGPRESCRVEDDLGPRVTEPHELDRRHGRHDPSGRLGLAFIRQGEHGPDIVHRPAHRLGDDRVGMAVDHRPKGEQVVAVAVAIDVPDVGTAAPRDDGRARDPASLRSTGAAVHAPGDDFLGSRVDLL